MYDVHRLKTSSQFQQSELAQRSTSVTLFGRRISANGEDTPDEE